MTGRPTPHERALALVASTYRLDLRDDDVVKRIESSLFFSTVRLQYALIDLAGELYRDPVVGRPVRWWSRLRGGHR